MTQQTTPVQDDWVAGAADKIIEVIDRARTSGTENAVRAIRGMVFGLVAAVFAIIAVVFTVVILVRLADAYLPIGAGVGDATWAAHLFIGGLLSILGFGMWASRKTEHMRRVVMAVVLDALIVVAIVCYALIDLFA